MPILVLVTRVKMGARVLMALNDMIASVYEDGVVLIANLVSKSVFLSVG